MTTASPYRRNARRIAATTNAVAVVCSAAARAFTRAQTSSGMRRCRIGVRTSATDSLRRVETHGIDGIGRALDDGPQGRQRGRVDARLRQLLIVVVHVEKFGERSERAVGDVQGLHAHECTHAVPTRATPNVGARP